MSANVAFANSPEAEAAAVEVLPVAGHIGAEIRGVDLRGPLADSVIAAIRAALLRHKVVFFRDQNIGHAEQVAFSRRFGEVTPSHPYDEDAPENFPEILAVDSTKFAERFGRKRTSYENRWHTDVTALVNPPSATVLRAGDVPSQGGDTQWTNLVAAYNGLPQALKDFVDTLRAEHRFGGRRPFWEQGSSYGQKIASNPIVSEHPVVRVHPETGERALFVTPGFTSRIIGLSHAQSDRILDLLIEEVTNPTYTVRFRWEPGSIAFWDNRATAHLAPSDFDPQAVHRVLYRTTLVGDIPVGPDGKPSQAIQGEPFYAVQ